MIAGRDLNIDPGDFIRFKTYKIAFKELVDL